jgi:hypothetical protein
MTNRRLQSQSNAPDSSSIFEGIKRIGLEVCRQQVFNSPWHGVTINVAISQRYENEHYTPGNN